MYAIYNDERDVVEEPQRMVFDMEDDAINALQIGQSEGYLDDTNYVGEYEMDTNSLRDAAGCFYDGGWRKDDYEDLLIEHPECTPKEAEFICSVLAEIEEREEEQESE